MMAGKKHAPLVVRDITHQLVGIQGGFAPPPMVTVCNPS
jgi:hypothetical protein